MQMVAVSPREYTMGSNREGVVSNETPHEVTIPRPFFVGAYEVTIAQTLVWLNSPSVVFSPGWIDLGNSDCPVRKSGNRFERSTTTSFASSDQQPMQNISYEGAVAFCEWCSEQDSRFKYRLPTEAEWEYLTRAGSTWSFPWRDLSNGTEDNVGGTQLKFQSTIHEMANGTEAYVGGTQPHDTAVTGPYQQVTTTVGSYSPNAWGLYDDRSALEWCSDWYAGENDAKPAAEPPGPVRGFRVLRGRPWTSSAFDSSGRHLTPYACNRYVSFRVVAE